MTHAWLLRMHPINVDRVPVGLRTGEISVGWGMADGLTDPRLSWWRFRAIAIDAYHAGAPDLRRAGSAAGQLWRFIREMSMGDLVLVPHWDRIHLARITGPATYDPNPAAEHWAHRRPVAWLTGPTGTPRHDLPEPLQVSLRSPRTCLDISRHRPLIRSAFPEAS